MSNSTETSQSTSQTKLQQDRQKLKEFYSKQRKNENGETLECQPEINQVKKELNIAIENLENERKKTENLGNYMEVLYDAYEKIDHQLNSKRFKTEIESLLSELK